VLAPEDRIFKAVLSPVEPASQPSVLKEVTERIFYDSVLGTGGSIARPTDWSRRSPAVESEFLNLTQDIASRLSLLKKIEEHATAATGKRVFLGACSTDLNRGRFRRLRRELLLEGHTVTSATPVPEETEADFLLRTGDAMHKANVAVFAISDAAQTPGGWSASTVAMQLESAFGLSQAEPGFSVFAWEDPAAVSIDSAALDRVKPNRRDQHIRGGKAFEYLQSNVIARLRIPPEPAVSEKTANSKTICIEYREEDGERAALVRDALRERNIQVQLAIPTPAKGTLINRIIKKNQLRYYSGAHGLVVFFGEGDYEWVSDVCFAMKDYVRPGTGVIMLGPPRDKPPGKDRYDQPGFQAMKCFEPPFGPEFEAWIEQLRSGAI